VSRKVQAERRKCKGEDTFMFALGGLLSFENGIIILFILVVANIFLYIFCGNGNLFCLGLFKYFEK